MKVSATMLVAVVIGVAVLCTCILTGGVRKAASDDRAALGVPLTERQMLERRRGNVGNVVIAGSTAR